MQPIDKFLDRLDKVRPNGKGYRARCPSHQSKGLTLSVSEGDDGRVLVYCFAGCLPSEVCHAVGLDEQDMFPLKPEPIYSNGTTAPEPAPYFTRKQIDEIETQVWFVAVAQSDMAVRKPISAKEIQILTRCIANLTKERWRLFCADQINTFLMVDAVLTKFAGNRQEVSH